MSAQRTTKLLLGAYAALDLAVSIDLGFYSPAALACVGAALLAVLVLAAGPARADGDGAPSDRSVGLWLLALALGGLLDAPVLFADAGVGRLVIAWSQLLLAGALVLLIAAPRLRGSGNLWVASFGAVVAVGTLLRLLVPLASQDPPIDVYTMREDGAAALLAGDNPYQTQMRDPIPDGAEQYGYSVGHYAYPPATLLPDALAAGLSLDVRFTSGLADLLACLCLAQVLRRRRPDLWRSPVALLAAAPLLYSKGPYVADMAWTEPLLLAALTLWWTLSAIGRERAALAAFGYFIALKQYLVFFALAFFGHALGLRRPTLVAVPVLVVLATALPFLIWDFDAFLHWPLGWMFQESMPQREDSLSLPNLLLEMLGVAPPASLGMWVGFGVTALLFWRWYQRGPVLGWRDDVVLVGVAATLAAFAVGPQAYANYYYLLTNALALVVVGSLCRAPGPRGEPR